MSNMKTLGQRGAINVLLIPLILAGVFFLGALGFGMWAFTSRADYKDNSDQKASIAAAEAIEATQKTDAIKYAEEAKRPYDTFIGQAAYGNITVNYPKTWSGYVIEKEGNNVPLSAYFAPKIVPDTGNETNSMALRVELVQTSYDRTLGQFSNALKDNEVTVAPYKLEKVPSVVGSRIEGQITNKKQGTMIILPLRNMTLKIWTESNDFKADLDTHILPNLSFVP